jgi:replication factor C subunit 3/5
MFIEKKYCPQIFGLFEFHRDIANKLQNLISFGNCPHLLFNGLPGSGKKTLIMALLRDLYGSDVEKMIVDEKTFEVDLPGISKKTIINLRVIMSKYHIEMNPSDVGNSDRYAIQAMIKEIAKSKTLDLTQKYQYRTLVLTGIDYLSFHAQQGLRRTMEKYTSSCRLLLSCTSSCRVSEAINSRCLCIRVPSPTIDEIVQILLHIGTKENLRISHELATRIAKV